MHTNLLPGEMEQFLERCNLLDNKKISRYGRRRKGEINKSGTEGF